MGKNNNKKKKQQQEKAAREAASASTPPPAPGPASGAVDVFDDDHMISFEKRPAKGEESLNIEKDSNDNPAGITTDTKPYNIDDKDPFATPKQSPAPWKRGFEGHGLEIQVNPEAQHDDTNDNAEGTNTLATQKPLANLLSPFAPAFQGISDHSARSSKRSSMMFEKGVDDLPLELSTVGASPGNVSGEKPGDQEAGAGKEADGTFKRPEYSEKKRRDELTKRFTDLLETHAESMEEVRKSIHHYLDIVSSLGARLLAGGGPLDKDTEDWLQPDEAKMRHTLAGWQFDEVMNDVRAQINAYHSRLADETIDAEKRVHALKVELEESTDPTGEGRRFMQLEGFFSRQFGGDVDVVTNAMPSKDLQELYTSQDSHGQGPLHHKESSNMLDQLAGHIGAKSKSGKTKKLQQSQKPGDESLIEMDEDDFFDQNRMSGEGSKLSGVGIPTRQGGDGFLRRRASERVASGPSDVASEEVEVEKAKIEDTPKDEARASTEDGQSSGPSNRSSDTIPELKKPEGKGWGAAPDTGAEYARSQLKALTSVRKVARLSRFSKVFTMPTPPLPNPEEQKKKEVEKAASVGKVVEKIVEKPVPMKTQWRDISWKRVVQFFRDQALAWLNVFYFLCLGLPASLIFSKDLILHKLIGPPKHPNKPTLRPLPVPSVADVFTVACHVIFMFVGIWTMAVRKERSLWLEANAETREFLLDMVHGKTGWTSWAWRKGGLAWGMVKELCQGVVGGGKIGWEDVKYEVGGLAAIFGLDVFYREMKYQAGELAAVFGLNALWRWVCSSAQWTARGLGFIERGPGVAMDAAKDVSLLAKQLGTVQLLIVWHVLIKLATLSGLTFVVNCLTTLWGMSSAMERGPGFALETVRDVPSLAMQLFTVQLLIVWHVLVKLATLSGLTYIVKCLRTVWDMRSVMERGPGFALETIRDVPTLAMQLFTVQLLIVWHVLQKLATLSGLTFVVNCLRTWWGIVGQIDGSWVGTMQDWLHSGSGFTGFGIAGLCVALCFAVTMVDGVGGPLLHRLIHWGEDVYDAHINRV